jgi:hypothetical protein
MLNFSSGLFSRGPKISWSGEKLVAVTGWFEWVVTLGLRNRRVAVDPERERVFIRDRVFWVFTRRRSIRFGLIRAVAYGYSDGAMLGPRWSARETYDVYDVGLKEIGPDPVVHHLFTFAGLGTFVNDGVMPDWWYWQERLVDVSGRQGIDSREFVEALSALIGKPVEPP